MPTFERKPHLPVYDVLSLKSFDIDLRRPTDTKLTDTLSGIKPEHQLRDAGIQENNCSMEMECNVTDENNVNKAETAILGSIDMGSEIVNDEMMVKAAQDCKNLVAETSNNMTVQKATEDFSNVLCSHDGSTSNHNEILNEDLCENLVCPDVLQKENTIAENFNCENSVAAIECSHESADREIIIQNSENRISDENNDHMVANNLKNFIETQKEMENQNSVEHEDGNVGKNFNEHRGEASEVEGMCQSSSSDSSSSSSSSDSSSDESDHQHSDSDWETRGRRGKKPLETKFGPITNGELTLENLPPLEDLQITVGEDVTMEEVGCVHSTIGVLVMVQADRNKPALNLDTILFLEGRKILGQVFETWGPVMSPLYSVRFNSISDIEEREIERGAKVYYAPHMSEYTHYVFIEQLKQMKGSDASWENNNEPPEKFLDYSDDEKERKAKAERRARLREGQCQEKDDSSSSSSSDSDDTTASSVRPQRGQRGGHNRRARSRGGRVSFEFSAKDRTTSQQYQQRTPHRGGGNTGIRNPFMRAWPEASSSPNHVNQTMIGSSRSIVDITRPPPSPAPFDVSRPPPGIPPPSSTFFVPPPPTGFNSAIPPPCFTPSIPPPIYNMPPPSVNGPQNIFLGGPSVHPAPVMSVPPPPIFGAPGGVVPPSSAMFHNSFAPQFGAQPMFGHHVGLPPPPPPAV